MDTDGLHFRHLTKAFGGRPVLRGLSASLSLSKVTYVVGRSGGGKSVLCRLAVGLLPVDSGEVELLGQRVDLLPERALLRLRRQAPYLVQGPALLDWLTLAQNVALANRGRSLDETLFALSRVGLAQVADRYPTELGPGVRKRAAIARALVLRPRYLLLDEPTTGLDRAATRQINQVLSSLRREGLGALVVSHDYRSLEETADEVLAVVEGTVAYQGTPAGFFSSPEPELRALTAPEAEAGSNG